MKKLLAVFTVIVILAAGCSKKTQFTNDLTGTWSVYKVTYYNAPYTDSFTNYSITFTSAGQYVEQDTFPGDTAIHAGSWQFQNSYGQLVLTDSAAKVQTTYTVFDLTGNSMELLNNGYNRYFRKN